MNQSTQLQAEMHQERYAMRVVAHLSEAATDLPYDISERLRAARVQALAKRKRPLVAASATSSNANGSATLTFGDQSPGFWGRLGSILPLVALVVGLVTIHVVQNDSRARELAEVDVALLTDDLPPAAYADPGFLQFLKAGADRNVQ